METGRVDRPRSDTLLQVCAALGLSGDGRQQFLRIWGIESERRVMPPEELVADPAGRQELLVAIRQRMRAVSARYAHLVVTIDERGNNVRQDSTRLAVAQSSGVHSVSQVWIADHPELLARSQVGNLHGCVLTVDERVDDVTQVIELDFGRRLAKGEAVYFGYSRWIPAAGDPPEPTKQDPFLGCQTEIGLSSGAQMCVLEVQFAASRRPSRCVYLLRRQLGGSYEQVRDVPLSQAGLAQLSLIEPMAAWHGIGWIW